MCLLVSRLEMIWKFVFIGWRSLYGCEVSRSVFSNARNWEILVCSVIG